MDINDLNHIIELIANRKIEEAMKEGMFDNLPGKGKPLPMDEEWFVPPEWRLAFRVLKNAGVLPEWLQRAKEIEAGRRDCVQCLEKARGEYVRYAQSSPARFRTWYVKVLTTYYEAMQRVNHQILQFNLSAPASARVEVPYRLQEALEHFQQEMPPPEGLEIEAVLHQLGPSSLRVVKDRRRRMLEAGLP